MSNQEWFRKTTWTKDDQDDFFAHLKRSRKSSREQYLKIQAHYLLDSGSFSEAALELVNLAIAQYPESIFLAELYEQKAKCLDTLGLLSQAEQNFQLAFAKMRQFPNVKPTTHITFGLFVVKHKIARLYSETIKALDEFTGRLVFPADEYYYFGIKAVINNRQGNRTGAKSDATKAIEASTKRFSGFSRHPMVALITEPDQVLHKELMEIVN